MQARIFAASLSAIIILALGTGAAAQQRVSSGDAEQRTSVQGPYQVQAQPQEASGGYIKIEGLDGEDTTPPPRPNAAPAPRAQASITTNGQALVPEQPVCGHCGSDILSGGAGAQQEAPRAPNSVTTTGQAVMPELPICAHCGADVVSQPTPQRRSNGASAPREQISLNYEEPQVANSNMGRGVAAPQDGQAALIVPAIQRVREAAAAPSEEQSPAQAAPAERPRRRGGFSLTIGGVTVGSGGVSVAVGDIDGDSAQSAGRQNPTARPARASSAR